MVSTFTSTAAALLWWPSDGWYSDCAAPWWMIS